MTHKNTFYTNIFLILATTVTLLLSSCNNLLPPSEPATPSSDDGKYLVISATLESSLQTSRSAVPSGTNILNELSYAADFHASTGTIIHDYRAGTYDASTNKIKFKFSPPTEDLSNYVLDIYGFPNGTEITQDIDVNKAILKGSAINITVLKDAGPLPLSTIKMEPYEDSSTLGTVNLSVSVPSGYDLAFSVIDKSSNDATGDFSVVKKTGTEFSFTHNATKNPNGIEKGTYTVTFTLKKGDVPFYAWTEKIIVYAGMVTDHWNTGEVNGESRVIPVSQISTSFYVHGDGGTWYSNNTNTNISSATASNGNSGSMTQPLATVQEAINRIKTINDGNTNYTIYVDGTVQNIETGTVADFSDFGNGKVSIIGLGTSQAVLKGNKGATNPTSKNSVVIIPSGVELTLENLLITEGQTSGNGGGINNAGKLTMITCGLADNNAGTSGGGIFLADNANAVLDNCVIEQNFTSESGGGICAGTKNSGQILEIKNSEIKNNTANKNGGGINVYGQVDKIYIENTKVMNNTALGTASGSGNGGGININGNQNFSIYDCTEFIGNTASGNGDGIYHNGANLKLYGTIKIDDEIFVAKTRAISLNSDVKTSGTENIATLSFPNGYDTTNQVLKDIGGGNAVANLHDKFVVNNFNSSNWEIDVNGKLVKYVPKYSTVYLDAADGDDANEGTELSPVKTLANALAHLDTSVENPTIMVMSPYSVGASDNLDFSSLYPKQITIKRYKEFKQKEVNNMKYDYMLNFSSGTKTISNVIIDGSYKDGYESTNAMSSLLYISGADVKIGNNTILQNNYGITSSGIYLGTNCSVEIDGAEIKGNKNDVIYSYTNGTVTIKKCSFTGNSSGSNSNRASIHSKNITLSGEIADGDSIYITTGSMDNPITIGSGFSSVNPITITNDIGSSGIGKSILTGYVDTDVCEKFELGNSAYIIEYKSGTQPKGVIALKSPNSEAITVEIDGVGYSASLSSQKDFDSDISLTVMKGSNNITSSSSCDYKMYVYTMDDYSAPIETFDNTPINLSSTYKTNLGITKFRVRVVVIVDGRLVIDDYINVTLN